MMLISASVRPRGLKRGRNMEKKLAEILHCEADLRDMVGRLELSADRPSEFAFLRELYWVIGGDRWGGGGTIQITNARGHKFTYSQPVEAPNSNAQVPGRDPVRTSLGEQGSDPKAEVRQHE